MSPLARRRSAELGPGSPLSLARRSAPVQLGDGRGGQPDADPGRGPDHLRVDGPQHLKGAVPVPALSPARAAPRPRCRPYDRGRHRSEPTPAASASPRATATSATAPERRRRRPKSANTTVCSARAGQIGPARRRRLVEPLALKGPEQDRALGAGSALVLDRPGHGQHHRLVQDVHPHGGIVAADPAKIHLRSLFPQAFPCGAVPGVWSVALRHRRRQGQACRAAAQDLGEQVAVSFGVAALPALETAAGGAGRTAAPSSAARRPVSRSAGIPRSSTARRRRRGRYRRPPQSSSL